jgi:hypothetical protein
MNEAFADTTGTVVCITKLDVDTGRLLAYLDTLCLRFSTSLHMWPGERPQVLTTTAMSSSTGETTFDPAPIYP